MKKAFRRIKLFSLFSLGGFFGAKRPSFIQKKTCQHFKIGLFLSNYDYDILNFRLHVQTQK